MFKLFNREVVKSEVDQKGGYLGLSDIYEFENLDNQIISPQKAMSVPTVSSCVELISTSIGSLPVKIYERSEDGSKVESRNHPASKLVRNSANKTISAGRLRQQLAFDALLYGNGFAYVLRIRKEPVELIRLDPQIVTVNQNIKNGQLVYVLTNHDGTKTTHSSTEILHVRAPVSYDGVTGVSPIQVNTENISLAITMRDHASQLFRNGAHPSGIISIGGTLTKEAVERIRSAWQSAHGGRNSGGTAILEGGTEFKPLQFSSVDAQFTEAQNRADYEICKIFNMPPSMVGIVDRATWSNAETQNRQFLTFCLRPWLAEFEDAYARVLLKPADIGKISIEFKTQSLLKADTAARSESYSKLRAAGVMTANEVRAAENLPRHPDGDDLQNPYTQSNTEKPDE